MQKRRLFLPFIALVIACPTFAATYQWDPNGATAGLGGAGTWLGNVWDGMATGSNNGTDATATITWDGTHDAIFGGAAGGTVTRSAGGVTMRNITFNTAGYTLTGTSIITLGGTTPTLITNADATVSSVLTGSSGLTKTGSGALTLNGSTVNTLTGGITIHRGTLLLDYANLATPSNLINNSNALQLGGGMLNVRGRTGAFTTSQSFANTTLNSGASTLTTQLNSGTSTTVNLGAITRNAGSTLNITASANLTNTASTTERIFTTGITYNGTAVSLPVSGNRYVGAGVFSNNGPTSTRYAQITSTGQFIQGPTATPWVTSGGDAGTVYNGTSPTTLTGATTMFAAVFNAPAPITQGLGIFNLTTNGLLNIATGAVTLSGAGNVVIGAERELVINSSNTGGFHIASAIVNNPGGASGLTYTANTASTLLLLSGASSYTGSTFLLNGTTQLTGSLNSATRLNLANESTSAKFILGGAGAAVNQTVAGLTSLGTGGNASVVGGNASVSTLTVNLASGANHFAGVIGGGGTNENSIGLTLSGAGSLSLSGNNTYTGVTTVNGGILNVGNANALGSTAGGTSVSAGGTLNLAGFNIGSEVVTLNGPSATLLSTPSTLDYGVVNSLVLNGGGTIGTNTTWTNIGAVSGTGQLVINSASFGVYSSSIWSNDGGVLLQASQLDFYSGAKITGAGGLTISGGVHNNIGTDNIADTAPVVINGGRFLLTASSETIGSLAGSGGRVVGSNTTARVLTVAQADNTTYGGTLGGSGTNENNLAITKTGSGTLTLTGNNTYVGATTVTDGTLVVNGSLGNTTTTIGSSGTLSGIGTLGGIVGIAGTLAPGNSIGTLSFSQTLSLSGISDFEIDPTLGLGLNSDLANVSGEVSYGGILNVLYSGPNSNFTNGMVFNLFDGSSFSGSFTTINLPDLTGTGLIWQDNLATNGTIAVVPEPGVAIISGIGFLALLRRRRD